MFRKFPLYILLFSSLWAQAQKHEITVKIASITPVSGQLRIGIFNSSDRFPEEDATFMNKILDVNSGSIEFSFADIPTGTYCVSLYHDKNGNEKFDFNFIGWPLETYGFSNNVFPRFRAPTFDECSIYIEKDMSIDIILDN